MIDPGAPLNILKILVLDDDSAFLKRFYKIIRNFGHDPTIAKNQEEAIRLVKESYDLRNLFDVAFIDYLLPNLNGVEIAKKLKAIDPDLILIAITRDESIKTKMLIIDSMVFRLLISKSISLNELESLINVLVSTKMKQSSGKESRLYQTLLDDQHKANKKKEATVTED